MTSFSEIAASTAENRYLLDASALLAFILREPGGDFVGPILRRGAMISAINLAEVVTRLIRLGHSDDEVEDTIWPLGLAILPVESVVGWQAGYLSRATASSGLSLGDRVCLSLARQLGVPALTADRRWSDLDLGVEIVLCR